MKRAAFLILAVALARTAAGAGCTADPKLSFNAATREWTVDFAGCTDVPMFAAGSHVRLLLGGTAFDATVVRFLPGDAANPLNRSPSLVLALPSSGAAVRDPIDAAYASNTASLESGGKTWTLVSAEPLNVRRQSFAFGPASAGDPEGEGKREGNAQAFRLQLGAALSRRPPVVKPLRWRDRLQRDFALAIDTTDQKSGFVDNNSVSAGLFLPHVAVPELLAEGKAGAQLQFARGMHSSDHDLDATAVLSGWLPFVQSVNLFAGEGAQRGSPLSIDLAYGYRSKKSGRETLDGTVLQGSAEYHFYLLDNYRVDLSATTTYSDLRGLPAGVPKTQHHYKARILYAVTRASRFSVATSVESGSIGPVATRVRNYFIGVVMEQLFEGRAGGNR